MKKYRSLLGPSVFLPLKWIKQFVIATCFFAGILSMVTMKIAIHHEKINEMHILESAKLAANSFSENKIKETR